MECKRSVLTLSWTSQNLSPMEYRESSPSRRSWSVSALCRGIADIFDENFNPVQVVGEVGSFVQAASGHCYFNLKDAQSQIRCAMFRRTAVGLSSLPANGDSVEVIARVAVHAARGDLQLVVDGLRPAGQGTAMEQFLRLKSKLEQEGLFSATRKREIPAYPSCIGVVTSMDAAALSDVLTAMGRRAPHIEVVLSPCAVQGADAPGTIVDALELLYARCSNETPDSICAPEVILAVRGGGAWEDLQAFNDENVARCIARSPVPVISGVGHETDFTIADFVADVRAATPTAAAELCAVAQEDLQGRLNTMVERLGKAVKSQHNSSAQQLDWIAAVLARPDDGVRTMALRLEQLVQKLNMGVRPKLMATDIALNAHSEALVASCRRGIARFSGGLATSGDRLTAANPAQILSRGFAWLEGPQGLVTSVGHVAEGDAVRATLVDGVVELVVADIRR